MDPRSILREQFLTVVDNQLRDNDPPETAQTLERLQKEGYSKEQARELISSCVAQEIFSLLNENRPFDKESYLGCLNALPKLPE